MGSFDFSSLTAFLTALFEAFKKLAISLGIIEAEAAPEEGEAE